MFSEVLKNADRAGTVMYELIVCNRVKEHQHIRSKRMCWQHPAQAGRVCACVSERAHIARVFNKTCVLELWFLNFLIGNLRAYGGCLDSKRR